MQVSAFYPRLGASALSFEVRPAGLVAPWDQAGPQAGGQACYLGTAAGQAQVVARPVFGSVPNGTSRSLGVVQLLSDPLAKQEIPTGNWRLAFGARLSNAAADVVWKGRAALHLVNGQTGARRATIFNLRDIGSSARTSTAERTCYQATVSGLGSVAMGGDYLALELGLDVANTSGAAVVPQAQVMADGGTPIASDNAATADAQSLLVAPLGLLLSLPEPGEQPFASVSLHEAAALLKQAWPPNCQNDWNDATGPDYEWILWQAELFKRYGWDYVDLLDREADVRRAVLSLPTWEALFELLPTRAATDGGTTQERRNAVISRFRELGPATLHNIASAVGPLTKFDNPSQVPLLEVHGEDLFVGNAWAEDVGLTIPEDSQFREPPVAGNLTRWTPVLLDGGVVWNTGALLILQLSNTNTRQVHFRLTGPDFTAHAWDGGPGLAELLYLRSAAFADAAMHGAWRLDCWRDNGAPAVQLVRWTLYVLGQGHGGRGQWKFTWAPFLDPTHRGDERAIKALLSRIRHGGHQVRLIYSMTSIPGSADHRAGQFVPGL